MCGRRSLGRPRRGDSFDTHLAARRKGKQATPPSLAWIGRSDRSFHQTSPLLPEQLADSPAGNIFLSPRRTLGVLVFSTDRTCLLMARGVARGPAAAFAFMLSFYPGWRRTRRANCKYEWVSPELKSWARWCGLQRSYRIRRWRRCWCGVVVVAAPRQGVAVDGAFAGFCRSRGSLLPMTRRDSLLAAWKPGLWSGDLS